MDVKMKELERLDNEFKLMELADTYRILHPGAPTTKTGWSDEKLQAYIDIRAFPANQNDEDAVKATLAAFWYYWIHGSYPNKSRLASIIINTILLSIVPKKDKLDIEYLIPIKPHEEEKQVKKVQAEFEAVPLSDLKDWVYDSVSTKFRVHKDHYQKFASWVKDTLLKNNITSPEYITLRKLTSVLSLMCLRATVKPRTTFENLMYRKDIISNIQNVTLMNTEPLFAAPCKSFVNDLYDYGGMNKNDETIQEIMALVVNRYTQEKLKAHNANMHIIELFNYSCLAATALNGLACIKYLLDIEKTFPNIKLADLGAWLNNDETKSSWDKIMRFLNECNNKDNFQYSSHWCRLINDEYYSDLAPERIAMVIVFLAGIVSNIPGNEGVWESAWAKKFADRLPQYKKLGMDAYRILIFS